MSYIRLGRPKTVAKLDTTGLNSGNWTNAFTHDVLGVNVPYFELYKMTVKDVPAGINTLTWFVGNDLWSSVQLIGPAEWDPQQPLLLSPDDDVFVCWNAAATGTPPKVQVWLRFDPAINPQTGA